MYWWWKHPWNRKQNKGIGIHMGHCVGKNHGETTFFERWFGIKVSMFGLPVESVSKSRSCGIMDMSGFNAIWEEINTKDSEAISREERSERSGMFWMVCICACQDTLVGFVEFVGTFRLWKKWTKTTARWIHGLLLCSGLTAVWSVWILIRVL